MQPVHNYLAVDLGASSGRAMVVRYDGARFSAAQVHRFENGPLAIGDGLFWDAPRLFEEIKTGLRRCTARGERLSAIGIDAWGVDFGLLDAAGRLIDLPRHYRDPRNAAAMAAAHRQVPCSRIYESTGIQFMPLNTLYQLYAAANSSERRLADAKQLLFMPDLFAHWLTGQIRTEPTIASTSQMLNAQRREWDHDLLTALGLPPEILPPLGPTGSIVGALLDPMGGETGQLGVPVVATASHDTASAVAAVPARGADWAYISSGTWSLVGLELSTPRISAESRAANFTNEAGVAERVLFLKNVTGLWLVQECRRGWAAAGRAYSYEELNRLAEKAEPLRTLINPDDPRYAAPGDVPERIALACRESGEPMPRDHGGFVRCILDSLALCYDEVLRNAAALAARRIETVHVVGGGSQNALLNQLIADATGRLVVAGPAEATALGNAAVQALALGHIADLAEARRAIAASVELKEFSPANSETGRQRWAEARARFMRL